MQRLIQSELFGAGLISVRTPELVGRYNACLERCGVEPTSLEGFRIDGIGWSPEIAEERRDPHYLSHGCPNQMAILLTPDQRGKPIYFPTRSFDRAMIEQYFDRHLEAVVDLTASTGIWLDIDLELSHYETPRDLLLVDHATVRTHAGELVRAARDQRDLAERFLREKIAWFDASLRRRIMTSARRWGDLRGRELVVPNLRYEDLRDFHTRAFGGVFVLRSVREGRSLLILEDEALASSVASGSADVYWVGGAEVLDRLHAEDLIEIDLDRYRRRPELLAEKLEHLVVDFLSLSAPEAEVHRMSAAQRKQRLVALRDEAPPVLFELERLMRHLQRGARDSCPLVSAELQRLLLHPAAGPGSSLRALMWRLLCRVRAEEPLRLYIHDKNLFFERYRSWPAAKRNWVVRRIRERYRPVMDR